MTKLNIIKLVPIDMEGSVPDLQEAYKEAMRWCYQEALKSPDLSTQNAAVILPYSVMAHKRNDPWPDRKTLACNRPPRNWKLTSEDQLRPRKYEIFEHAERGSIYAAASYGIPTWGATMVCPWAACVDCARAIVESHIAKLVTRSRDSELANDRWTKSIELADEILQAGGVELIFFDDHIDMLEPIRRNGDLIQP
jgi:deoxycytidylate deaminase